MPRALKGLAEIAAMRTRNVVNLDALIRREDFATEATGSMANKSPSIDIHHLDDHFFSKSLRKPDFQRETAYWSPQKVADLVRAFVDSDLIPAVIFWQSGPYVYVIDGAHRLSALVAWVKDDYGDGPISQEFMGGYIPPEQDMAAKATRRLIENAIGSYAQYSSARGSTASLGASFQRRLAALATNNLSAQWVPTVDATAAQAAFFKINEAATPLDHTEQQILKSRKAPNAIAARAIVRAGQGNKYWKNFQSEQVKREIEELGRYLFNALFEPPIEEGSLKTLDVPVAGRGYNTLPFVFDLVNLANDVVLPDRKKSQRDEADEYPGDPDGTQTIAYLKRVRKVVDKITGASPGCLGLHPIVYFYTRTGVFQPTAFLSIAAFLEELISKGKLKEFTAVRSKFEDFLIAYKHSISSIVHKYGSKQRSLGPITKFFTRIFEELATGKTGDDVAEILQSDPDYKVVVIDKQAKPGKKLSRHAKSATYLREALSSVNRCGLCDGALHRKSMNIDHVIKRSDGGDAHSDNGQLTHYFCNSSRG